VEWRGRSSPFVLAVTPAELERLAELGRADPGSGLYLPLGQTGVAVLVVVRDDADGTTEGTENTEISRADGS